MTTHSGYLAANPWRGVITSQLRLAISALNCVFEQVFAFRAGEESAAMAHVPRHTRRGRASGRLVACCADSTAMTHTRRTRTHSSAVVLSECAVVHIAY